MNAPVLVALEQRAGASDQDRDAWLADRREGPTATEIRDLMKKKITIPDLVARKLGRIPEVGDLSHIPVIGWGKLREPIIAAEVERRYSIRPESRVFRAADEPRFLASPDGVGVSFDEDLLISEIKTAGMDIAPWTDAYDGKGYEYQMQWGMRVTGARRCLYAYELREELPGGAFVNGPLKFTWIERDEKVIYKLEQLARRFLAALDKAAAEPAPEVAPIDEVLDTHAVNYLRFLDEEKDAKTAKEREWAAMLSTLGARGVEFKQVGALARVTFSPAVAGEVDEVDYAAAEAADPELFAQMKAASVAWAEHCEGFMKSKAVPGRVSLRVTSVKQAKAEEQDT